MPKHIYCQLSLGSRRSETSEDSLVDVTFSDGEEVQTSAPNREKMMRLVDAVPVPGHHRNDTLVKEDSKVADESHVHDNRSKDANRTPKTFDASHVSKEANKTVHLHHVHLVRGNETLEQLKEVIQVVSFTLLFFIFGGNCIFILFHLSLKSNTPANIWKAMKRSRRTTHQLMST